MAVPRAPPLLLDLPPQEAFDRLAAAKATPPKTFEEVAALLGLAGVPGLRGLCKDEPELDSSLFGSTLPCAIDWALRLPQRRTTTYKPCRGATPRLSQDKT